MQIHKLIPRYVPKIWGMNDLSPFYNKKLESKIGEIWLTSTLKVLSHFRNGTDLKTFFETNPHRFNNFNTPFPLLTKIITPKDYLSVQVHPNDEYAWQHHQALGKPEAWYVLDAPKGAHLIYGHNAKTKNEFEDMIDAQSWNQLLNKVPVKKGDFLYVPPGKVHAISPGVVVCEIQRSSDITYRLYDFNRVDENHKRRDLHIAQSLDVVTVPDIEIPIVNKTSGFLIDISHFSIYLWDVQKQSKIDLRPHRPYWLQIVIVGGKGTINSKTFSLGDAAITLDRIKPLFGKGTLKVLISWISHP